MRAAGDPVTLDSPAAKFLAEAELAGIVRRGRGPRRRPRADRRRRAPPRLRGTGPAAARPRPPGGGSRARSGSAGSSTSRSSTAWTRRATRRPPTTPSRCRTSRTSTDSTPTRSACGRRATTSSLNGWELGSGSIRIHRPELQRRIFAALGISEADAESRFGFLLDAYRYGGPPHGGFAVGLDRFVAILAGEENIREVIAFPKTQSGSDPMTGGPLPLGAGAPGRARRARRRRPRRPSPRRRPGPRGRARRRRVGDGAATALRPLRRRGRRGACPARRRSPPGCGPRSLEEFVGQRHLVGAGATLRALIEADRLSSAVFFGPAGSGKTTLARIVAASSAKVFVPLSATSAGVKDIRETLEAARRELGTSGRGTILFLDEIHRFSPLPAGRARSRGSRRASSYSSARRRRTRSSRSPRRCSRARRCGASRRSAGRTSASLGRRAVEAEQARIDDDALEACCDLADGDARAMLTTIEIALAVAHARAEAEVVIGRDDVEAARTTRAIRHGRDAHYDIISAFIKSVRGSDPDAGGLLARPPARRGRGPAVRRPPARHPRQRGRGDGRPARPRRRRSGRGGSRPGGPAGGGAQPRRGGRLPRHGAEVEPRRRRRCGRRSPTSRAAPSATCRRGCGVRTTRAPRRSGTASATSILTMTRVAGSKPTTFRPSS